ncbi:MAG: hypothetical protein JXR23_06755 [Pontiellaceae bacterium]|nr:hypothetical protein [Pontiellaceae bacterium]
MNTGPTRLTPSIDTHINITPTRRNASAAKTEEPGAYAHASEKALMLSRNLSVLHDQLAPRADVVAKFRGFAEDSSFTLDNKTIDQLIDKMKK